MGTSGIFVQSDFTAGELSPALNSRLDMSKYGKGCRTMRNFLAQPHGPALKRPGFILLGELPGEAVLLEFAFNQDQAYALIFGEKWLRLATAEGFILDQSGQIYQISSPYTLAQARELSFVQSGDLLYLAHQALPPYKLMRYAHADWRFACLDFSAPCQPPPNIAATGYWNAVNSDGSNASKTRQLITPYSYYVTAINAEGKESSRSSVAEITGPAENNWQAGDYIRISWSALGEAEEYRIYKASFGGTAGYIGTSSLTYFDDHNIASSLSEGLPDYIHPFILTDDEGKEIEDYPGAVCLFEQRLVLASTPRRPQTVWLSKSGDYENFATYSPQTADSPLELTIASREVSAANWMISLRSLILGTSGVEWEISAADSAALSADNARATPQSYWGSSLKRALVAGNVILHVASSGRQVRNLQYDFAADSYAGSDLSIMAAHLLENYAIKDWCYQKNPHSIIWALRDDGSLLGFTFQAEHQIAAWHRHDTQGEFLAICAVPNGADHCLFSVIRRGQHYFLERMAGRYLEGEAAEGVWLDCALTYRGDPVKVLAGLDHLEGYSLGVWSEAAVEPEKVVQGGKIELEAPSSLVTVGLPYTAELETMPLELLGQAGSSLGLKKRLGTVNVSFASSLGVELGFSRQPGNLEEVQWQAVRWRSKEPYGSPPAPFSGVKQITLPISAENTLSIALRSSLPTPVTVQSLMARVEILG